MATAAPPQPAGLFIDARAPSPSPPTVAEAYPDSTSSPRRSTSYTALASLITSITSAATTASAVSAVPRPGSPSKKRTVPTGPTSSKLHTGLLKKTDGELPNALLIPVDPSSPTSAVSTPAATGVAPSAARLPTVTTHHLHPATAVRSPRPSASLPQSPVATSGVLRRNVGPSTDDTVPVSVAANVAATRFHSTSRGSLDRSGGTAYSGAGGAAAPGSVERDAEAGAGEDGDGDPAADLDGDMEYGPLVDHHHGRGGGVAGGAGAEDEDVTGTIWSSSINLTNTILGAGVLAMPGALTSVGLGLGVFLIVLSAAGSAFGLTLLALCAQRVQRSRHASFFAVSNLTYPQAALWFDLAIAVKCFGVSVSYLVIIRDLMPKVALALSPDLDPASLFLSKTFWVTASILAVSPFAFARRLDSLRYTSALALLALVYVVLVVVGYFLFPLETFPQRPGWEDIKWIKLDEAFLKILPIFVFAFTCHQNIFAVHNELQENTVHRVTTVVHLSVGTSTFVYQLVGILGYLTFAKYWMDHPEVQRSNIIQMYPSGPIVTLGQCALAVLFLLSYPLQCHPARACLDKVASGWFSGGAAIAGGGDHGHGHSGGATMPASRHVGITTALLIGSFLLAVAVDDLSTVLSLVGATGSTTICYILPGMLYYKMRDDMDRFGGYRPVGDGDAHPDDDGAEDAAAGGDRYADDASLNASFRTGGARSPAAPTSPSRLPRPASAYSGRTGVTGLLGACFAFVTAPVVGLYRRVVGVPAPRRGAGGAAGYNLKHAALALAVFGVAFMVLSLSIQLASIFAGEGGGGGHLKAEASASAVDGDAVAGRLERRALWL
ncbi:hypothetical protein HDU96_005014 [Phlyctochytrium bullatum]|nr:hypothetical protein HDU96_005014 [Phlyctochytrium bullatum]